jgi:multicomponent Na+:H+ antiporter subunit G
MNSLVIDWIIYVLLFIGVCFGGIGVIGLLLFPDIRSRMYTAVRATIICVGAIALAVMIFSVSAWLSSGGDQYLLLAVLVLIQVVIVKASNIVLSNTVLHKTVLSSYCAGK